MMMTLMLYDTHDMLGSYPDKSWSSNDDDSLLAIPTSSIVLHRYGRPNDR